MGAWPFGSEIVPNQQIVIFGFADHAPVTTTIGKRHPVYLLSETERVELIVMEAYDGQLMTAQVLLRPKTMLVPGHTYRLVVENLSEGKNISRYDYKTNEYVPIEWMVSGAPDTTLPQWAAEPIEIGKHYIMFGCGPALGVEFKIKTNESLPMMVKVELMGIGTDKWHTYYLPVSDGKIDIGHGMCGGEFTLREAKEFEVKFTLVDGAGNSSPYPGPAIRFTRPPEMNQY